MRASETDRVVACPASQHVIGTKHRTEKADIAAAWGDLVHHWKETGETNPAWAKEKEIACLDKKLLLSDTQRDYYWRLEDGEHEVSFALHLVTLEIQLYSHYAESCIRRLEPPEDRDDWKARFGTEWLTGTVDWLHWGTDETVPWIDDLKTGHWPVDPKKAGQLRSYALLPWVLQGCPIDWECAVSVTKWERYPLAGRPTRSAHRLSGLDLAEHLEALRHASAHHEEVDPLAWDPETETYAAGEQCLFCPNRLEHPASGWLTSYRYSRLPSCWAGIKLLPTELSD